MYDEKYLLQFSESMADIFLQDAVLNALLFSLSMVPVVWGITEQQYKNY